MNMFLKALPFAMAGLVAPLSAVAADYVDNEEITTDTFELIGGRTLRLGDTWTTNFTLADNMPPFYLSLLFTGNANIPGVLSHVRYGIGSATIPFQTIVSSGGGTGRDGQGTIENAYIDRPFSIVYSYLQADVPNRRASLDYSGSVELVPTSVPEIGSEGALSALLLAIGSILALTGRRRNDRAAVAG